MLLLLCSEISELPTNVEELKNTLALFPGISNVSVDEFVSDGDAVEVSGYFTLGELIIADYIGSLWMDTDSQLVYTELTLNYTGKIEGNTLAVNFYIPSFVILLSSKFGLCF